MRKHASLLGAVLLSLVSALSYAQAPVPFINLPLLPDATAPGGAQFTLTVNGTGFVSTSVVNWNGSALATQFVSGSQLTAIVPAADIATASTGWVTVVNPAPGGGTSSVAFFTARTPAQALAFNLGSTPTASGAWSVAAGDFNGDGNLDLAVVDNCFPNCNSGGIVTILLGDGKGHFTLASTPAVGDSSESVAVGDFNGDGKLDLAVVNRCGNDPSCQSGGTVSILLGDGTGNFTLASSPALGNFSQSVAVGDFNGDGNLDLAVTNPNDTTISILLGDGTGHFTLVSSPSVGGEPMSVAVGDFNGDGKLDLATANWGSNTASVLLGDGTGHFTLISSPAVGLQPFSIAAGDFNGDGNLDLAVTNTWSNTVSVLLGDGTGQMTLASSPATGEWPDCVAVGDFNGDGKLDLAVVNGTSENVSILLGDSTGNFTLASSPAVGYPNSVALGDFNGDGQLDLAVVDEFGTVPILLQVTAAPAVTLSPTSLTFGTQLVGTSSSPQPVTLTNTGNVMLSISKIAASASFSQTNNCPSSVPPNGQCTINVTFRPHDRGRHTGTLTITDNAPNSPQTVPLNGVGTAVSLVPSGLDFGDQKVGTTSQPQVATLTNYGKAAVEISRVHFTGKNAGAFAESNTCGTSVPAGGNCTTSVTFAPKATGPKAATLEVKDNGGASPQTVGLSGTGTK
jgi:hypothetical protein